MTTGPPEEEVSLFVYSPSEGDHEDNLDHSWREVVGTRDLAQFVSHLPESQPQLRGNPETFDFSDSYYLVHTCCSFVIGLDISSYMLVVQPDQKTNLFRTLLDYLTYFMKQLSETIQIGSERREPVIRLTFLIFSFDRQHSFFTKVLFQALEIRQGTVSDLVEEIVSSVMRSYGRLECDKSAGETPVQKSIADILQVCIYSINFLPASWHKHILLVSLPLSDFPDMPAKNYVVSQLLEQHISCSFLTPVPSPHLTRMGYFPNYSAIRFLASVSQGVVFNPDSTASKYSWTNSDILINLTQKLILTTYFQSKSNKRHLIASIPPINDNRHSQHIASSKHHKLQILTPPSFLLTALFQLGFLLDPDPADTLSLQLSLPWDEYTSFTIKISEFTTQSYSVPFEVSIFYTSHHLRIIDLQDYCLEPCNMETLPFRTQQVVVFRKFFKELKHKLIILDCIYNLNLCNGIDPAPVQIEKIAGDEEHSRRHINYGGDKMKAILSNKVRQWHTWMNTCVLHLSMDQSGDSACIHNALLKLGGEEIGEKDFYLIQFEEDLQRFCFVSIDFSYPPIISIYFGFHFSINGKIIKETRNQFLQSINTNLKFVNPEIGRSGFSDSPALKPFQIHTKDITDILRFGFKQNGFLTYDIIKYYFFHRSLPFTPDVSTDAVHKLLQQIAKYFVQNKVNNGWTVFKSNHYTTLFDQILLKNMNCVHKVLICYFLYLEESEHTWRLRIDFFHEPIIGTILSDNPSLSGLSTNELFDKIEAFDHKILNCALNYSSIGFGYQIGIEPDLQCLSNACSTLIFDAPLLFEQSSPQDDHQLNDQIVSKLTSKLTQSSCSEMQTDVALISRALLNSHTESDHYFTNFIYYFKDQQDVLRKMFLDKLFFKCFYKLEVDSSEAYFIALPTCTQNISDLIQDLPNCPPTPSLQTFPILISFLAIDRVSEVPSCHFYGCRSGTISCRQPRMPFSLKQFLTYLQGELNKSFVEVVVSHIGRREQISPVLLSKCLGYCSQERFHSSLDLTATLKALSTVTALRPVVSLSVDTFLREKLPWFILCPERRGLYYFSSQQFLAQRNSKLGRVDADSNVQVFIQFKLSIQRASGVCEDLILQDFTFHEHLQQEEQPIRSAVLGVECYIFDTSATEFSIVEREGERTSSSGNKQSGELHLSLPPLHPHTSSLDRREISRESLASSDSEDQILVKLIKSSELLTPPVQVSDVAGSHDGLLTHLLEETQWQINDLTVGALSNNLTSAALLLEIVDHIKQGEELCKQTCKIYHLHENITYSMLALTPATKERFMRELDCEIPGIRSDRFGAYYNLKLADAACVGVSYWLVMEVSTESPAITFYTQYNPQEPESGDISSRWLFEKGNEAVKSVCRKVFQITLLHDLYNNKLMYSQLSVDYHPEELEEDALCFFQSNLACPHRLEYTIPVHWRLGRQMAQSLAKKYLESLKCKNANSIYILEEDAATDRIYYMYINTVDNDALASVHNVQEGRLGKAEDVILKFDVYGVATPSKRYQDLVFNNIEDKMYNEILTRLCDSFSQQANIQLFAQDVTFLQPESKVDCPEESFTFNLPYFVEFSLSSFLFYLFQHILTTCTRLKKKCFAHDIYFQLPSFYPKTELEEFCDNFFISAGPIQTRSIILIGLIIREKSSLRPVSYKESLDIPSSRSVTLDSALSELSSPDGVSGGFEVNVLMWQHGNADCKQMQTKILNQCRTALIDFVIELYLLQIPHSPSFISYSQSMVDASMEASASPVPKEGRTRAPSLNSTQCESRDSLDGIPAIELLLPEFRIDKSNTLDEEFIRGVKYINSHLLMTDTSTLKRITGQLPETCTITRFFTLIFKKLNQVCKSFEFTQELFQQESEESEVLSAVDIKSLLNNESDSPASHYFLLCRNPFHWLQSQRFSEGKRIISKKVAHTSSNANILKFPLDPYAENVSRGEPFYETFKQQHPDDVITRQAFIFIIVDGNDVTCVCYNCSKSAVSQLSDCVSSVLNLIKREMCIWRCVKELKESRKLEEIVLVEGEIRDAFLAVFKQELLSLSLEELLDKLDLDRISTNPCDFCHFSTKLNQHITQYLNSLRRAYLLACLDHSKIPLGVQMSDIDIILSLSTCIYHSFGDLEVVHFLRERNIDSQFQHIKASSLSKFKTCLRKNSYFQYIFIYGYILHLIQNGFILIFSNTSVDNQYELYLSKTMDFAAIVLEIKLDKSHFTLQIFVPSFSVLDQTVDLALTTAIPPISIVAFEINFCLDYVQSLLSKTLSNIPPKMLCVRALLNVLIPISQYNDLYRHHIVRRSNFPYKCTPPYPANTDIFDHIITHPNSFDLSSYPDANNHQNVLIYQLSPSIQLKRLSDSLRILCSFLHEFDIYFIFDVGKPMENSARMIEAFVVCIDKILHSKSIFTSHLLENSISSVNSDQMLQSIDFKDCLQSFLSCILEEAALRLKKEAISQLFISSLKPSARRPKLTIHDVIALEQCMPSHSLVEYLPADVKKTLTLKKGRLTEFLKRKDQPLPGLIISGSVNNEFSIYLFLLSRENFTINFVCFYSTQNGLNEGVKMFQQSSKECLDGEKVKGILANNYKKEIELIVKALKTSTWTHLFK